MSTGHENSIITEFLADTNTGGGVGQVYLGTGRAGNEGGGRAGRCRFGFVENGLHLSGCSMLDARGLETAFSSS
jgi:hypothetical protein